MSVAIGLDTATPLSAFDVTGDPTAIGPRWERWIRAFDLFASGRGVKNNTQKRALMLSTAGLAVQDIFYTLPDIGAKNKYDEAVAALSKHFKAKTNYSFERFLFKGLQQQQDETIDQFFTRLTIKAQYCNFGTSRDEFVKDQIIAGCASSKVRSAALEKDLDLNGLLELARAKEASSTLSKKMKSNTETVNKVSVRQSQSKSDSKKSKQKKGSCYRCGQSGHFAKDDNCPAREKSCHKCGLKGHFSKMCKTKGKPGTKNSKGGSHRRREQVNYTSNRELSDSDDTSDEYAFTINAEIILQRIILLKW